jgi:EmrB/QacA subfamily drug resistance transporter
MGTSTSGSEGAAPSSTGGRRTGQILMIVVLAQYLMVLDTTVMNVSIATLVSDLHTTVTGVQGAITLYTLIMAMAMIPGGKLGDRWGRRRAFRIGLVVYAIGSGLTAISPNINVLYVGWSVIEGLGAALIMPALPALIAGNFVAERRAQAYGLLAAAVAAAAATGPIIGGYVTTEFSWRWIFLAESVLCLIILTRTGVIAEAERGPKTRFDLLGATLSATGLGLIVFGVVRSSEWGWITPRTASSPSWLGLSPVVWLVFGGLGGLWLFLAHETRVEQAGAEPLVAPGLFANRQLRSGLQVLLAQSLILSGMFFALPLFLSIVLGLSALETGIAVLPLSISLVLTAVLVPRFAPRAAPRLVVRVGLGVMLLATVILFASITAEATARSLAAALLVMGVGIGLLASQLGNIIVSSEPVERSSEVGGLQYTAQNLGASLGVALVGAMLIAGLSSSLTTGVESSPTLNDVVKHEAIVQLQSGVAFVSNDQVHVALARTDLGQAQQDEIIGLNVDARLVALRRAMAAVGLFVVLALFFTGPMPKESMIPMTEEAPVERA